MTGRTRSPSPLSGELSTYRTRKGNLQLTLLGVSRGFDPQVRLRAKGGCLLATPVFDLSKWVAGRRLARAPNRVRRIFAYGWNRRDCSFWISRPRPTRAHLSDTWRAPDRWALDTGRWNSRGAVRGLHSLNGLPKAEGGDTTHLCLRGDCHAGTWLLVNRLRLVRSPSARRNEPMTARGYRRALLALTAGTTRMDEVSAPRGMLRIGKL